MPKDHNYMEILPDEVLCMLFDRLDLDSVKAASRVCQRWKTIIFFSGYVDRFMLDINILNKATTRKQQEERQLKRLIQQVKQLVAQTQRHYRGLSLGIEPMLEYQFPALWKAIHPKITQHLRELELDFIESSMAKIFPLIVEALPTMQHLQSLNVVDYGYNRIYQKKIPTLRNQSAMHLSMDCNYKFTVDMPQLQTYDGALCALLPPDNSSEPAAAFEKLTDLTISVKGWKSADPSIFRRMPCLKQCDWNVPLDADLFSSMSETCPSLTSLWFSKTLYTSDLPYLKSVLKLTQLRDLMFHRINQDGDYSGGTLQGLDFSKLTQLESLDLGKTVVQTSTLLNLPKSVRKVALHIDHETERRLIDIITCNLQHLTELRLAYYRAQPSRLLLKSLSLFEQLEVLQFSRCHFTQSSFLRMDAPLPRLHTLRFKRCKLETKHLLGLQGKFPQLKACEFLKCFVMTECDDDNEYQSDDTFESGDDLYSEDDILGSYDSDEFSEYTDSDEYQYDGSDYELGYDDYALLSALADMVP
ncbi:uncharacterized protein LOC118467841 [Anopheles albimanus]|uniref:F-box domain-containing protein n=1 Tax=Anopheles albimanus TaxID=7167 RepID=A0A182G0D2_ANOAL|nr:uncharacterized protein LOC118467841 [Anopheles albimanus]